MAINYETRLYKNLAGMSITLLLSLISKQTTAQIVPDGTLPVNSVVTSQENTSLIEGGTARGSNLFHSFNSFSILTGNTAHFNNSPDITNILTRVTGGSISNIDGVIKANGTANLFFINPNGIVFGKNARLDIGGSFLASTASSLKFASGLEFSAVNPQAPPLLTINVPIGLQFGVNPGLIQVQGNGQGKRINDSPIIDTQEALRVQSDKTLALVGGDINLEGATLKTAGGRIELGSVKGNSLVSLTLINKGFALNYDDVQNFGDIKLSQKASVDASGEGAGDVQVQGRRIVLIDSSSIETSTLLAKQGGDLIVNATELLEANQSSNLSAFVYPKATGNGGNLTIKTRKLLLQNEAEVGTNTRGRGKGGNFVVNADSIQVIGISRNRRSSLLATTEDAGSAGNLTINTRELLVQNGGQVSARTSGVGKGGNLDVTAQTVQLINGLLTTRTQSIGDAGNLTINTRELLVQNGGQVSTITLNAGKAGNLNIDATEVQLIGYDGLLPSGLGVSAERNSTGDAGSLTIKTNTLLVRDGAQLNAITSGAGRGGNLSVDAQDIQLIGTTANGEFPSGLSVSAQRNSTKNAGSLRIKTNTLLIQDGAQISAATFGAGKGGNLSVDAQKVQLIGRGRGRGRGVDNSLPSALGTSAQRNSTGDAGDLTVTTNTLIVQNGAEVSTDTFGGGKGGNLSVNAQNVQLIGISTDNHPSSLGASAMPNSTGDAGDLKVKTNNLLVQTGARVGVQSSGTGTAGNLIINANSINLDDNALITADTRSNRSNITQATININSGDLTLRRNSSITTNATNPFVIGGDIIIGADVLGILENSKITANSANFRGGNINITTQGLFRSFDSAIAASGATSELSGNVNVITILDPSRGLVEIPINLVEPSGLILARCSPRNSPTQNSFTVTGRGGLPISPEELLQDVNTIRNWINSSNSVSSTSGQSIQSQKDKTVNPIVEASGWKVDNRGQVYLVANTQDIQSQYFPSQSNFCPN
jgi:filamentous hemagglutinin family protein